MSPINLFKFFKKEKGRSINLINLFKFLEKEKGRPIPFSVKLAQGIPLTPDDLNIEENLILWDSKITSLPQGLKVGGSLYLDNTEISSLPSDLKVEKDIFIEGTPLAKKSNKKIRAMLTTGYIKGIIWRDE
jgi:hypothetical protein